VPATREGFILLSPSRVRLFLCIAAAWLCADVAVAEVAEVADDGDVARGTIMLHWMLGMIGFLGAISLASSIYKNLRPYPPLGKQFAPAEHQHPDYATVNQVAAVQERLEREHRDMMEHNDVTDRELFGSLRSLSSEMAAGFQALDSKAETRAEKLHNRINPMGEEIVANKRQILDHISNHAARRND